jgi:predicted NBD/HSP70 family sugar kinase
MAETLFGLGDIGASETRVTIMDEHFFPQGEANYPTNPDDYKGSVEAITDKMQELVGSRELAAASIAVAAEVDDEGNLIRAGGLSPWLGHNLGEDSAIALGLPYDLVGTPNDAEAIGISQQAINLRNRRPALGVASTLSSGWGGSLYTPEGKVYPREPGHDHLREGAVCPCGKPGCAEAFISGKGVLLNHDTPMKEWLEQPGNAKQFVMDGATAVANFIRNERASGVDLEEFRWTGGVALNQYVLMNAITQQMPYLLGDKHTPAFDVVTMGPKAGLHGTFVDAQRRLAAA